MQQSFGSWLMAELESRKKKPADLARALEASPSTVSSWTNPKKGKRISRIYAVGVAAFLGIPVSEVLRRAGLPDEEPETQSFVLEATNETDEDALDQEIERAAALLAEAQKLLEKIQSRRQVG